MAIELENRHLRVELSANGLVVRIDDVGSGVSRRLVRDGWAIGVGDTTITDADADVVASAATVTGHRWRLRIAGYEVEIAYHLRPGARYLRRSLRLGGVPAQTTVREVRYGPLVVDATPAEVVAYDTFRDCPTVVFVRWDDGSGWFLGVEDPIFETRRDDGPEGVTITQRYEPGLMLAAGDGLEADAQFIGSVRRTGEWLVAEPPRSRVTIGERWRRGRFRDPMGHVPIDRGEVAAMRAFLADHLAPLPHRFRSILYTYWYPLPQPPLDALGVARWMRAIDTFADLGGDLLLTTPLARSALPDASPLGYWDLAPAGSAAEQVMRHAVSRGVGVGLYMGVAAGNLEHGNAAALDYPADAPDAWKKIGEDGTVSGENCMASDGFMEWSVAVQANTIERFGLAGWSWDPGPGNGRFCYASGHGHLPGEGSYRGWRNATEVRRRLKERFPELFLQAFYGQKEDGPWGLRHFDQHEAYWEQQVEFGASVHPDISSDRMNADGVRLQAWCAQNFRFLPAQLNHALVGRITQYCMDDPSLTAPWDHAGWRYALLSGLAVGGSITATILPDDLDSVDDMRDTYAAWLAWARRHEALVERDIALGAQVRAGGVDIHARVDGRGGIIFLANPGPRPATARVPLDESIGLEHPGRYRLVVQTPDRGPCIVGPDGTADLVAPMTIPVDVPPHTVLVLAVEAAEGPSGTTIRSSDLRSPTLPVDGWVDDRGAAFAWPLHPAARSLRLSAVVRVEAGAVARIRARRTRDADAVAAVVATQRARGFPDTFAWSRPDRLLLVVPFADADQVGSVALRVDGRPAPIERFVVAPPGDMRLSGEPLPGRLLAATVCWWADLTDAVREGLDNRVELDIDGIAANQFLGPWLESPGARWDLDPPEISCVGGGLDDLGTSRAWSGPVPDAALPTHPADDGPTPTTPRVLRAWLEPVLLRAGRPVTIRAELDADDDRVSGVYCSTLVGPGVFTDVGLRSHGDRTWSHTFMVGDRREVILDPAVSSVWAVGTDGRPTAPAIVPIRWVLEPRRPHTTGKAGASGRDR